MDLEQTYDLLVKVGNETTAGGKQALLQQYLGDEVFRQVVYYALNPYLRFGVKPGPAAKGAGHFGDELGKGVFELLDKLADGTLRGNEARYHVLQHYQFLTPNAGIVLTRILYKDLRIGATANTMNKVWPKLIPSFNVMLAKDYQPKRVPDWPVAVQPKYDGVRVLTYVGNDNSVEFFSRSGRQQFADMPHVRSYIENLNIGPRWLDGEVISTHGYNDAVSKIRQQKEPWYEAQYVVFDTLSPKEFTYGTHSFGGGHANRTFILSHVLLLQTEGRPVVRAPWRVAKNRDEVDEITEDYWNQGLEGAVVKPHGGKWLPRRSADWLKIKDEQSVDVRVTGVFEGTGKYVDHLGGVTVDLGGGISCQVGTGFSDEDRAHLWNHPGAIVGRTIEVTYHEKTPDGSLRHPRFKAIRFDKEPA